MLRVLSAEIALKALLALGPRRTFHNRMDSDFLDPILLQPLRRPVVFHDCCLELYSATRLTASRLNHHKVHRHCTASTCKVPGLKPGTTYNVSCLHLEPATHSVKALSVCAAMSSWNL